MQRYGNWAHNPARHLLLSVLLLAILVEIAAAKKQPKTYPEEGKIVGNGLKEHIRGEGSVSTYTHTYKVQTGSKVLELDCGIEGSIFHSYTGKECGGVKPLKVGDVIHFRIEKEWLCIPITAEVPVDENDPAWGTREDQIEQKLRILSEDEAPKENPPAPAPQGQQVAESNVTKLSVASMPAGADIEVDGGFVGNTPSTVDLTPGDHTVTVSKNGYKSWERKLKANGGNVNLNVELEAQAK